MIEIFDDIREIYDFSLPCEALRYYIEFFSESSPGRTSELVRGEEFTVEMFPSWTPTFWINLGAPYRLITAAGVRDVASDSDVLVLRDTLTTRYNLPTDHLFTVKFYPGGLEAVLGIGQTNFSGKITSLKGVLPDTLLTRVKRADSFGSRMALLENFFLSRLSRRPTTDHYVQLVRDSIGLFEEAEWRPNTGEVAERMFVHSKTINRYFHSVIGLPPKKYFGILRARAALSAYVASRKMFDATAFGYYDHSHFRKEVAAFTGRKLSEFYLPGSMDGP
jgi:AraC-like DNA-binding protein